MTMMIKVNRSFSAAVFAAAAVLFVPAGLGLTAPGAAEAAVLPDFTDLVDRVGPAVVNIRTTEKSKAMQPGVQGGPEDEEMQEFSVVSSVSPYRPGKAPRRVVDGLRRRKSSKSRVVLAPDSLFPRTVLC